MTDTALYQARTLSSGTMATLTGETLYRVTDAIRQEFVEFVEKRLRAGKTFRSWVQAWHAFREVEVTNA